MGDEIGVSVFFIVCGCCFCFVVLQIRGCDKESADRSHTREMLLLERGYNYKPSTEGYWALETTSTAAQTNPRAGER